MDKSSIQEYLGMRKGTMLSNDDMRLFFVYGDAEFVSMDESNYLLGLLREERNRRLVYRSLDEGQEVTPFKSYGVKLLGKEGYLERLKVNLEGILKSVLVNRENNGLVDIYSHYSYSNYISMVSELWVDATRDGEYTFDALIETCKKVAEEFRIMGIVLFPDKKDVWEKYKYDTYTPTFSADNHLWGLDGFEEDYIF